MVLPLIPLAMFGGGLAGGAGIGSWLGGGKKEIHATKEYYAPTTSEVYAPTHAPQLQFAPVTSYAYQGATNIISSPGASITKKQVQDVVSRPEQKGTWEVPIGVRQDPTHAPGAVSGVNMTHIALISAVAVVAYAVIGKGKKKRK